MEVLFTWLERRSEQTDGQRAALKLNADLADRSSCLTISLSERLRPLRVPPRIVGRSGTRLETLQFDEDSR